jgi:hypothetical protein
VNHLPYDAFSGSLVEQDLIHVVDNEEPPCEAIKQMTIGVIRPQEIQVTEEKVSQDATEPNSIDVLNEEVQHTHLLKISRAAVPPLPRQHQQIHFSSWMKPTTYI